MIDFNEDSFTRVASAVVRFNPHAGGYSVEQIIKEMKAIAVDPACVGGWIATRGYQVNVTQWEDGTLHAKASIDAGVLEL